MIALPYKTMETDRYTEDEYFAFEQDSFGRWEYIRGEIRAMAGGTDDHNTVLGNIGGTLRNALSGRECRVYFAEMKVHTGDNVNTFPDVMVVCGPRQYHKGRKDIVTNPVLVVEVLSESTQDYDRGEKFDHYKTIPTLMDYLIVFPDKPLAQLYSRQEDHWNLREMAGRENEFALPSVQVSLALADIYAQIEFVDDTSVA